MTVVILTHNEAVNIVACVEGLRAFAEIFVVDSGSTDRTVELVHDHFPDIRVLHHAFQDFGQQRNWALDHVRAAYNWILFFDADERCTPAFAEAIDTAVSDPRENVGFFLCYRNMFLGRWIKRCTMYPTWQLRLLKVGHVRYVKDGHGQREVMDGKAGYIDVPYDHFGFNKGIREWIARHNEYSTNEVELLDSLRSAPLRLSDLFARDRVQRHRALKRLGARTPLRPVVRFFHLYVIRGGYLDGRAGLLYCCLQFAHELHILAKRSELNRERHGPSHAPLPHTNIAD